MSTLQEEICGQKSNRFGNSDIQEGRRESGKCETTVKGHFLSIWVK